MVPLDYIDVTSLTVNYHLINQDTGQVFIASGAGAGTTEAFSSGHWSQYNIAATDPNSIGVYSADISALAAALPAGNWYGQVFVGTGVIGDAPPRATFDPFYWNGTKTDPSGAAVSGAASAATAATNAASAATNASSAATNAAAAVVAANAAAAAAGGTPVVVPLIVARVISVSAFAGPATLNANDNFYNGETLTFTSGALNGQYRKVTAYIGASNTFVFSVPFTGAPSGGDTFILTGAAA